MRRFNRFNRFNRIGRRLYEGYYDKMREEGDWLKIKIDKKGLTMTLQRLDRDDMAELQDAVDEGRWDFIYEMFEDIEQNSELRFFGNLSDAELGMSSAPGITAGYGYDEYDMDDDMRLFYFKNYARTFIINELLENGEVFFHEAK